MIQEDYVSFEIAKLLKEKGFDETCRAFWKVWDNHTTICDCSPSHLFEYCHNSMLEQYNDDEELNIACPTLQMAMKWLREKHSQYVTVKAYNNVARLKTIYYAEVQNLSEPAKNGFCVNGCLFKNTYEEAVEYAIKYCLENLI